VEGNIFVLSAPSGAGKSTLIERLRAADPRLKFSVSYTTRPPREGEIHGEHYYFITPEEFHRRRGQGGLVEWVEQFDYYYGTGTDWVQRTISAGSDALLDLEIRGARALKAIFPAATLIFLVPPSLAELERRLTKRGNLPPRELAARLAQGQEELKQVHFYDYVVVNADLEQALADLRAIVTATRLRTAYLWPHLAARFQV
jgi:guanylate kinase